MKKTHGAHKRAMFFFWLLALTVTSSLFYIKSGTYVDPDYPWHVLIGRSGSPRDFLTYTFNGSSGLLHSHSSSVLFSRLHDLGGYQLSNFVTSIAGAFAIVIANINSFYLVPFSIGATIQSQGVRSHVFGQLLLALVLFFLQRKSFRFIMPVLFFVWAEMHGSWPVGLSYYTVIVASKIRKPRFASEHLSLYLLSILAIFFSSFNPEKIIEVAQISISSDLRGKILEWMPQKIPNLSSIFMVSLLACFMFVSKKINTSDLFSIVFFFLSITQAKTLPLFAIFCGFSISEKTKAIFKKNNSEHFKSRLSTTMLLVFSIGISLSAIEYIFTIIRYNKISQDILPSRESLQYIQNDTSIRRLYTIYNWGPYIKLETGSTFKYFIDGRMPLWNIESNLSRTPVLDKYLQLYNGDDPSEIFNHYCIDTIAWYSTSFKANLDIVVPKHYLPGILSSRHEWSKVYDDRKTSIWKRNTKC